MFYTFLHMRTAKFLATTFQPAALDMGKYFQYPRMKKKKTLWTRRLYSNKDNVKEVENKKDKYEYKKVL